jgi:hypothetical protein
MVVYHPFFFFLVQFSRFCDFFASKNSINAEFSHLKSQPEMANFLAIVENVPLGQF